MNSDTLTTGDVALICRVASRTVSKWFDSGKLKGYLVPGSKDRRIPRAELVRFMREAGMPIENLDVLTTDSVLLVGLQPSLVSLISSQLDGVTETVASSFQAGIHFATARPRAIIVDYDVGRSELDAICRAAKAARVLTLVLGTEECDGASAVFRKPVDVAMLVEHVRIAISLKKAS